MSYKVYSGTGTVYMAPVNSSGVRTGGFIQVGDAYPLSVQVTTKQTEVRSRMVERAGQIIASKNDIDTINGSLTLREWNAHNLAWAVSGTATDQTAAGGTVSTPVELVMPVPGTWLPLPAGHRGLSDVVVTNSAGDTTYAVDVVYLVDLTLGLFTSVAGAALAAGNVTTKITYKHAARTDFSVAVGSNVQIRVAILAHLYDEYRQEHYELEIDSAVLAASQEINFISEADSEGEPLQFSMVLETLSGASSPMRINGVPA
jgi:hypothetical protein